MDGRQNLIFLFFLFLFIHLLYSEKMANSDLNSCTSPYMEEIMRLRKEINLRKTYGVDYANLENAIATLIRLHGKWEKEQISK